jgi:hypothetical protein
MFRRLNRQKLHTKHLTAFLPLPPPSPGLVVKHYPPHNRMEKKQAKIGLQHLLYIYSELLCHTL